ncbi:unnamed protein product [Caenorhabditis angaria]|uniref:Uncharacterized protein n=1 Tax=Caenorhabditis angaria TaxID=860376 RepID=A0A9P1J0D2_9PELO|nr:unnamed protein product [Caenorhabditis angaria]
MIFYRICCVFVLVQIAYAYSPNVTSTESAMGKSSISGISVTCHTSMENCLEACYMSCYITDLCNDEPDMVACAPGLTQMVILTLLFVILITTCCGVLCFFAPCCCCAIIYKGYRARQAGRSGRNEPDNNVAYPSAPPLIAKV